MPKFSTGKNALAISDRSGFQYPYRLMRREWNGLLVGPDEYEPKHPQLGPFRKVTDPQALENARPEQSLDEQRNTQYGFNPVGYRDIAGITPPNKLVGLGQTGTVNVFIPPIPAGSAGVSAVGTVTVVV